ncbi:BLUF domain-containing protein [Neorhodopirellula pilleata]|uniref:Blue light-and temperature-regulated antirepressor YcgF n=1 Tax=Neorhodopirellula pilleata TaxID=2714738 RepID=A0A5C5ZXW3_9BACT|nr:BLUF domain-containing protein [Neorhodopirellula pilleata]TWT92494.1 Blue light- and temperature-regulated antirepressor YcgF [Neorhodopirellula pilleata]
MIEPNAEPSGLRQLIYASAASDCFDESTLDFLLARSRTNNARRGLTGILLYHDRSFFQVLEGPADAVGELFGAIQRDPRHTNSIVLADDIVDQRNFGQWQMGFSRDLAEIACLEGFVDFFDGHQPASRFVDLQGDTQRVRHILDSFRRGRWRRHTPRTVESVVH